MRRDGADRLALRARERILLFCVGTDWQRSIALMRTTSIILPSVFITSRPAVASPAHRADKHRSLVVVTRDEQLFIEPVTAVCEHL